MQPAFAGPCLWASAPLCSTRDYRWSSLSAAQRLWTHRTRGAAIAAPRRAARLGGRGGRGGGGLFVVVAVAQRSDDGSRDAEFDISDLPSPGGGGGGGGGGEVGAVPGGSVEKRNELFEFVKQVPPPELIAKFASAAPPVVQKAIRQTIVAMLGTLPIGAFAPSVKTVSSNLVQLFHSSLISGYMFRNAAYRLELTRSLGRISDLPALPGVEKEPEIRGGVAVFQTEDGNEMSVPVDQYVAELRSQVNTLRDELVRERKGGNELLSFISTLEPENLESLTKNAGEEVIDAMKRVVAAVTKAQGLPDAPDAIVDASSFELGQLLFYLMVSGFFLREAEVRVELQRSVGGDRPINLGNLLEGKPDTPPGPPSEAGDEPDGMPPLPA